MEPLYMLLFVCYASYAYNRKSVIFSMPMLKAEGLDASDAGLIASCQNIAFSISKFLAGILSDRLNPNVLFSIGMFCSGCATIAFSSSYCVTDFCFLWFLNGLAQGCGWPACAKILSQRASPSEFGTLWSFLSSSNNFSGSIGPFLSAIILVNFGWRWNVFFAGAITLLLLGVFIYNLPNVCDAETVKQEDVKPEDAKPTSTENKDDQVSILVLFRDPFIQLLSACILIVFCARTTTIDWGQLYLMEEMHQSQYVAGAFTSSVETGGFLGRMIAGYFTDWLIKRSLADSKEKSPHWKPLLRMSVAIGFVFGSLVSLHLFRFRVSAHSSAMWITFIGTLMGFCYYGPISIFGIVSSECVPPHLSGASHAIVALFENLGATVSGLPLSFIAKYYNWSAVFLMLEILTAGVFAGMLRYRTLTPNVDKAKTD